MNGILVDSDVLIDILRQRKLDMTLVWRQVIRSAEPIFYSPVSQAEIRQGMRESEKLSIDRLFEFLTCLPIDDGIGQLAGDYLRAFGKSHALELGDALIAATAMLRETALWTHNRKHFPMRGVQLFREPHLQ